MLLLLPLIPNILERQTYRHLLLGHNHKLRSIRKKGFSFVQISSLGLSLKERKIIHLLLEELIKLLQ